MDRIMTPGEDTEKLRFFAIFGILSAIWPSAEPLLVWRHPFELLCAVILSAQCTDEQVNKVTPELFGRWPDASALAEARTEDVESVIHSVGFFRTKAAHLVRTAGIIAGDYEGKVPDTMEGLLSLPGVGRKTANLVLSASYGDAGIIVDTHVLRVSARTGLHARRDPAAVEKRIAALVDMKDWTAFSHAVNRHGKFTCTARKPACALPGGLCPIEALCPKIDVKTSST
jgi:endonuclease-3